MGWNDSLTIELLELPKIQRMSITDDILVDSTSNPMFPLPFSFPPQATPPAKQEFAHFMLKEIYQQPEVIQTCLTTYGNEGKQQDYSTLLNLNLPPELTPIAQIHLIASGTSRHAGLVAQVWLEQIAGIPTRVDSGSEFQVAPLPLTANTLTIGITQSGETADTMQALEFERQRHSEQNLPWRSLGITNQATSSLAKQVDAVLPTLAGTEIGVAATKTFTTQLVVFFLLTLELAWQRQTISRDRLAHLLTALPKLPNQVQQILQQEAVIQALARRVGAAQHCIILGRGVNRAIALEAALKLKETSYLHAEGYSAGEFMHGPIALLDQTIPVIAIAPAGAIHAAMLENVRKVRSHGAPVIGIVTADIASATVDLFDAQVVLPPVDEVLSPILTVIPLQLLAYHIAVQRGLDVDRPRNITKTLV